MDWEKNVFSITDQGLVRQNNEDSCRVEITPNGLLLAVCDGMGGHVGGETASRIAVESIVAFWQSGTYQQVRQAMEECLQYANSRVLECAEANPSLSGMGSTACVALIRPGGEMWYAHIGDSRIYHFQKDGSLKRLTKDHSMVQGMVDNGLLTEAEAEHHPNRNRILKTLGVCPEIAPDICGQPLPLQDGELVLLCSDGLSVHVDDEAIRKVLSSEIPLKEKGLRLVESAKEAGGEDNITIQLACWNRSDGSPCPATQELSPTENLAEKEVSEIRNADSPDSGKGKKWGTVGILLFLLLCFIAYLALGLK